MVSEVNVLAERLNRISEADRHTRDFTLGQLKRALIEYVADRSPHKQGLLLPGSHLRVHAPARVFETKPDYLFILAWNLKDEVLATIGADPRLQAQFLVPIPRLQLVGDRR